jgi:FKBP-type peptidyl-prolyl cis-trans isomerase
MINKLTLIVLVFAALLCACKGGSGEAGAAGSPDALSGDDSYAFGMILGSDLGQTGLQFDYDGFMRGFKDSVEGNETRFSIDEAVVRAQSAFGNAMSRQNEELRQQYEDVRQQEMAFMADNSMKEGIVVTGSGLQYEVISEGTGPQPRAEDTVQVHYRGTLVDGTEFDSSYSRGEPTEFPLNQVIPGWTEGIQLMKVGSTYRFYIPSELAYGENGAGNMIPPYSSLIFEVELLSVVE